MLGIIWCVSLINDLLYFTVRNMLGKTSTTAPTVTLIPDGTINKVYNCIERMIFVCV